MYYFMIFFVVFCVCKQIFWSRSLPRLHRGQEIPPESAAMVKSWRVNEKEWELQDLTRQEWIRDGSTPPPLGPAGWSRIDSFCLSASEATRRSSSVYSLPFWSVCVWWGPAPHSKGHAEFWQVTMRSVFKCCMLTESVLFTRGLQSTAEVLDKIIGINQTSSTLHLHANITEACWVFLQLCVCIYIYIYMKLQNEGAQWAGLNLSPDSSVIIFTL